MTKSLEGKVALITGGASGIGFETAKRFISEGAYVFIVGRREEELNKAVSTLGDQAASVQGDITKQADLVRVMETIERAGRKLDIVVANAGIGEFAPIGMSTEEHFDRQFDINVKGTLFTVQHALPLLRDGASVVLTGSCAGFKGMPGNAVYGATKAAIRSFARTFASDLKDRKIRVNSIAPGVVPVPSYETNFGMTKEQVDAFASQLAQQAPLGRVGTTDEIAKAIMFLASDASSYVNGIELVVDGGLTQV